MFDRMVKVIMCHCGNTGVERTSNKSQHRELTLEKDNSPSAPSGNGNRELLITSPALYELSNSDPLVRYINRQETTVGVSNCIMQLSVHWFMQLCIVICKYRRSKYEMKERQTGMKSGKYA